MLSAHPKYKEDFMAALGISYIADNNSINITITINNPAIEESDKQDIESYLEEEAKQISALFNQYLDSLKKNGHNNLVILNTTRVMTSVEMTEGITHIAIIVRLNPISPKGKNLLKLFFESIPRQTTWNKIKEVLEILINAENSLKKL